MGVNKARYNSLAKYSQRKAFELFVGFYSDAFCI